MKRTVILLADGFEEVEAVTPIDYMRRSGIDVTVAGVNGKNVTGSRGIKIVCDELFDPGKSDFDGVVLPGGAAGAKNLAANGTVSDYLKIMAEKGKLIAAICASPAVVLVPLGLLEGKRATCYPGLENKSCGVFFIDRPTVTDGNIITSRGAGTAGSFALAIIAYLSGDEASQKVGRAVLL